MRPLGVGVFDPGVRVEHPPVVVEWEARVRWRRAVPFGVGGPPAVLAPRGRFARSRDGALEFGVEPDAPDGGALVFESFPLPSGRRGRWRCRGRSAEVPDPGRADLLPAGSMPRSAAIFRASAAPSRVRVRTLKGLPFGPVAAVLFDPCPCGPRRSRPGAWCADARRSGPRRGRGRRPRRRRRCRSAPRRSVLRKEMVDPRARSAAYSRRWPFRMRWRLRLGGAAGRGSGSAVRPNISLLLKRPSAARPEVRARAPGSSAAGTWILWKSLRFGRGRAYRGDRRRPPARSTRSTVPDEDEVGDPLRIRGGAPDLARVLLERLDPGFDVGRAPRSGRVRPRRARRSSSR